MTKNFQIKNIPHLCWDLNSRPPAFEASLLTIILTLQVKGASSLCSTKHVQLIAKRQLATNFANLENGRLAALAGCLGIQIQSEVGEFLIF